MAVEREGSCGKIELWGTPHNGSWRICLSFFFCLLSSWLAKRSRYNGWTITSKTNTTERLQTAWIIWKNKNLAEHWNEEYCRSKFSMLELREQYWLWKRPGNCNPTDGMVQKSCADGECKPWIKIIREIQLEISQARRNKCSNTSFSLFYYWSMIEFTFITGEWSDFSVIKTNS
jgi:hypothetical protein